MKYIAGIDPYKLDGGSSLGVVYKIKKKKEMKNLQGEKIIATFVKSKINN